MSTNYHPITAPTIEGNSYACVARLDKVEITICDTESNALILSQHHQEIAQDIAQVIEGKKKWIKVEDCSYARMWRIESPDVQIDLFFTRKRPIHSAGKIRIASENKWDSTARDAAARKVHEILQKWTLKYHLAVVEVALDTADETAARRIATTCKMRYGRVEPTFNFVKGRKQKGGSEYGKEEYQHYRSSPRQKHIYKRPEGFYRCEVTFKRPYLHHTKIVPGGINTIPELLDNFEKLVTGSLAWVKLDTEKLYQVHQAARLLQLEKLTPNGAARALMDYTGHSRRSIDRYFRPVAAPRIDHTANLTTISENGHLEERESLGIERKDEKREAGDERPSNRQKFNHENREREERHEPLKRKKENLGSGKEHHHNQPSPRETDTSAPLFGPHDIFSTEMPWLEDRFEELEAIQWGHTRSRPSKRPRTHITYPPISPETLYELMEESQKGQTDTESPLLDDVITPWRPDTATQGPFGRHETNRAIAP